MRALIVLLIVAALIGHLPVRAQVNTSDPRAEVFLLHLLGRPGVRPLQSVDELIAQHRQIFDRLDLDGGGLTEEDYRLGAEIHRATLRASVLSRWQRLDLDGDGALRPDEIRRALLPQAMSPLRTGNVEVAPTPQQITAILEGLVTRNAPADTDGDGTITFAEMLEQANEKIAPSASRQPARRLPQEFDLDADGTITREEYLEGVGSALASIDTDGDRIISPDEVEALRRATEDARMREFEARRIEDAARRISAPYESCRLPEISTDAHIVALSADRGQALSTVSVAGEDAVTGLAEVHIASGDPPIAVIVNARSPMIFRFTGDVARVRNVVVLYGKVGFTGIPGEIVARAEGRCPPLAWPTIDRQTRVREALSHAFSIKVSGFVGTLAAGRITLPEPGHEDVTTLPDAITPDASSPARLLWNRFHKHYPGGVVRIDAASVVGTEDARAYDLLPQEAGLVTLVENGALSFSTVDPNRRAIPQAVGVPPMATAPQTAELIEGQRIERRKADPNRRRGVRVKLRVNRQIHLPAGLFGPHAVELLLPDGVPAPTGKLPPQSRITHLAATE